MTEIRLFFYLHDTLLSCFVSPKTKGKKHSSTDVEYFEPQCSVKIKKTQAFNIFFGRHWIIKNQSQLFSKYSFLTCQQQAPRTTDTQRRHSENLGRCGRQNMLRPYLKIWEWELIFGRAVKAISSPGVRSPCVDLNACMDICHA